MRYLHEIPEYRNFKNYAIDTQGNVWSFKGVYPKKLKTSYKNKKEIRNTVSLYVYQINLGKRQV